MENAVIRELNEPLYPMQQADKNRVMRLSEQMCIRDSFDIDGNGLIEADFSGCGIVFHDLGVLQKPLQIADTAVVGSVFSLGSIILEVLA